jgi:molybdenum cofactor cytidylyltransferase
VPVVEADGAILAHGVRTPGGVFKKGQRLGPVERAALVAAGVGSVVVAQLEPHDVAEDDAAARIALTIVGDSALTGAASTGRVNIFAKAPGLLDFDPAAVDAVNAVSEDVTLATFPRLSPVEPGRMVATIKIIPFAVAQRVLERCIAEAAGAVISVAPFRPLAARLIQTVNAGLKPSVMAKTSQVTAARMARLGGSVAGETRSPHDPARLAVDMRSSLDAGCDLLLVIGASAIVDRRDVIPAAILELGGRIERLGMPVDPGNLILIGDIAGTPVLGLPGCARSPARNGLDWVLERLAAGFPLKAADVARMGVGGLLIGQEEEKDYL